MNPFQKLGEADERDAAIMRVVLNRLHDSLREDERNALDEAYSALVSRGREHLARAGTLDLVRASNALKAKR